MPESITITDNRSGESVEIPIADGGVDAAEWRKLLPNVWFYDEAFMTTAAHQERHHRDRRRRRHPPLPRLPHRAAGRAARPTSRSPTCSSTASCPPPEQYEPWVHDITYHTFIHENVRKRFLEGFHYDAHPMGMLVSAVAALSTFYLDAKDIGDPDNRYKQIVRLIAKMPTLAAACHRFSVGMPFVYPDNSLGFSANFLSMLWKVAEPRYDANPALAKALDVLFILHADHEQNCGTTAMRTVASAHADPYSCVAALDRRPLRPPPRRRQRGRHQDAHRDRLDRRRRRLRQAGQDRRGQAPGLRPPGLQELRPPGEDHQADRRRGVRDHRAQPAARHRPQARRGGAQRRLLHLPPALPERRLLLGPDLPGDGLPDRDVHRCCSPSPGCRAGSPTGSSCSSRTRRSPGPASSTSGAGERDYVPMDQRG